MADTELLPCPFCGGAARIQSNRDWHRLYADHDDECVFEADDHALMYPAQPGYLIQIAEDWNRRSTPPSPSTAPMCERKTTKLEEEGYAKTGYVLRQPGKDREIAVSDGGAVSWFTTEQWNWLMFNRDHVEFQWPKPISALASRPAEVDDEGLPDLPRAVWWYGGTEPYFSAEQYRQGQRDAVAADRARREVDGKIPRESNDALIKLAKYWKLDGDWMTCRGCRRSLIASRDGEELNHGDGCKFWDQHHPWAQLRELIARRPPAENTP